VRYEDQWTKHIRLDDASLHRSEAYGPYHLVVVGCVRSDAAAWGFLPRAFLAGYSGKGMGELQMNLTVTDIFTVVKARIEAVDIQNAIHYKDFWQDMVELAKQAEKVATLEQQP